MELPRSLSNVNCGMEEDISSRSISGQPSPSSSDTGKQPNKDHKEPDSPDDLKDMLLELRIPLQGTQLLTAFLISLPFSQGFAKLQTPEKCVYLTTFLCSVTSLILFSAPALHHRLERPLRNPQQFKNSASKLIIVATMPLSVALVLATQLVVNEVGGLLAGLLAATLVAALIGSIWWAVPLIHKRQGRNQGPCAENAHKTFTLHVSYSLPHPKWPGWVGRIWARRTSVV
jgi:hypothetical protein